jgi:hypothetical protein
MTKRRPETLAELRRNFAAGMIALGGIMFAVGCYEVLEAIFKW